jgi:hypothetical protein
MRTCIVLCAFLGLVAASSADTRPLAARGDTLPQARSAIGRAHEVVSGPEAVLYALFDRFENRDPDGWIASMSSDYLFESDDPAFHSSHPHGMSRDDELAFATHLFRGVARRGRPGSPLPIAIQVAEEVGPLRVTVLSADGTRVRALAEHLVVALRFADGTSVDLGATRNEFTVQLEDGRWWITRWQETSESGEPDAVAAPGAAGPVARPGVTDAAPPLRLALAVRGEPVSNRIVLSLMLPRSGGAVELYDVMGRRILRRDLDGVAAGSSTLEIPADGVPAGIYWARVHQVGESVSARLVWTR